MRNEGNNPREAYLDRTAVIFKFGDGEHLPIQTDIVLGWLQVPRALGHGAGIGSART